MAADAARAARTALALVVLAVGTPGPVAAQDAADPGVDSLAARRAAANTLLSLALPGAGQLREGRDRGWAYLAVEALGWAAWAERRHRGRELRTRYRDLAWEEGRIHTTPRVEGDFPYYEAVASWERSGAFDADPQAPGIQPEADASTYNGQIWALARGLFLPPGGADPGSPSWGRALDYYQERAYGEAFLWDWSEDPGARLRMGELIEESDDRFQQATVVLGAVLVNHLASAVDAWLSTSLDLNETSIRAHPAVSGPRGAWTLSFHIGALP